MSSLSFITQYTPHIQDLMGEKSLLLSSVVSLKSNQVTKMN
jgi:hypothetical protein